MITEYLAYYKKLLIPILLLCFVSTAYALIAFAFPWIDKTVYDRLIITYDKPLLSMILFVIFCLVCMNVFTSILIEIITTHIRTTIMIALRAELTAKLIRYTCSYFKRNDTGELIQRIVPEVESIAGVLATSIKAVAYVLQIIVLFCAILLINRTIFLVYAFLSFAFVCWHLLHKNTVFRSNEKMHTYSGSLYSFFYNQFSDIKHIKMYNLHNNRLGDLYKKLATIKRESFKNRAVYFLLNLSNFFYTLIVMVILVYCFYKINTRDMTIGFYLLFINFSGMIIYPFSQLISMGGLLQQVKVSAQRIREVTGRHEEKSGNRKIAGFSSHIAFRDVNFGYAPGSANPVVLAVTFTIAKGSDVAIVGKSGAGKTTLAHLLLRFYEPTAGTICIDDCPLSSCTLESLRSTIGLMTQDVFIFNDTIAKNIDPSCHYTKEQIRTIMQKVRLDSFIDNQEYVVGERGEKLSGGEKQRLALARLLIRRCPVIIFDEATSQIDSATETHIFQTLRQLKQEMPHLTMITITHRLQSLIDKDTIIVLNNGRVETAGRHEDIYMSSTFYRELFNASRKESYVS